MAMSQYREAIQGTMKVLDGASRKVIKDPVDFKSHVQKLKEQLTEIENKCEMDVSALQIYPGSTGNGDRKLMTSNSRSLVLYDNRSTEYNTGENENAFKISKRQHKNM